ncbi:MAG TPA: bifunctional YncE family protein/alkaline phosphatase family protein [Polyangia bacterium]
MRFVLWLAFVPVAVFVSGCHHDDFVANCSAGAPPAEASLPPGHPTATTAILPGGRAVTPAGTLLAMGGYPIALRLLPGDRYAVVTDDAEDDQALRVVDLQAADPLHAVVSEVSYPIGDGNKHTPGLFYGLALTKDGKRLYVSNGGYDPVADSAPPAMHYNTVQVFDVAGTPPVLTKNDALELHLYYDSAGQRVPTGVALSADESILYVANQTDNTLAILSLGAQNYGAEIGRAQLPGVGAFDVAVDEASHTAFVSLWGGDGNGGDGVVAVDVADPTMPLVAPAVIGTGKASEAELLVAGKLYVSNADADTLSIVDAAARTVKSLPATSGMILGATPNAIAVEPAGANGAGRVYVANAGENAVVALDLDTLAIIGKVPTAWYPTAVAVAADGSVVIASARGLGRGPRDGTPEPDYADGTLEVVPRPSDDDLRTGTTTVATNLDRPHTLEAPLQCGTATGTAQKFAVPAVPGAPAGLTHVFLIVKENKTYDGVLGDLAGGNGKAELVEFGADVTPNAHALASQFVLLDNFYSHAELSVQGHEWTTGCIANDYTEKSWSHSDDYGRAYLLPAAWGPAGTLSRLATPGSGSIWHHLDVAGVPYHNYGEITNTGDAMTYADPQFPGVFFNTSISDVDKAQFVLDNLNDPNFKLEPFTYLLLPNDHTNGTSKGAQTPQSMVADNDEGLGVFIEGLSKTPWWKSSVVFVVEDDPGGTLDHVEEHRSVCYVASPWVKRGYRSSTEFDLGSVYHTIELILGVGPMNLNDGHAAAMYELFTDKPDFSPWTHIPRKTPITYNSADAPMAAESAKIDFTKPDQADLTRILWKAVKGRDAEPPSLPARSKLDRDDDDD